MNALLIALVVILGISDIGLIVFILLHSGKGTGLSDMLAGGISSMSGGTSIVERNLDRITIVFALVFTAVLFAMMIFYPNVSNIASK